MAGLRIGLASDHGGFALKAYLIKVLQERGYEPVDLGTHSQDSTHYPVHAQRLCESVQRGELPRGILICGTGIGMSMVANRYRNIRAALCTDSYMARMSREHNDANILVLGERVIGPGEAVDILNAWLETPFGEGRHKDRLALFPEGCCPDGPPVA